jgi:hypothetical protein
MTFSRQTDVRARIDALDWDATAGALADAGWASTPAVLTPDECAELIAMYHDDARFRSRIDMARYRFGEGDYKYFAYPLPPLVTAMREAMYARLAPIANAWEHALGGRRRFPDRLDGMLALCARHGQTKPTPLLLHYETGGYNCLHQDLYGEVACPLQATCFLSRRGIDYEGGESLLVEQRPRAQSIGHVIIPEQGQLLIFTTSVRPVRGSRGWYRAAMRHGVSRITRGTRYTLGLIFHDAA